MEDRLGLSPMSMLRLRWEIEATVESDTVAPAPTTPGLKRRLKVV